MTVPEPTVDLLPEIRDGLTGSLMTRPSHVRWLIAEVERLRGQVDKSTGLVDALRRQCESAVAENRQLRARLREHDDCRTCGHERRQHGRDPVIRRDWCSGCKTSCDLPAFQPVEETLS